MSNKLTYVKHSLQLSLLVKISNHEYPDDYMNKAFIKNYLVKIKVYIHSVELTKPQQSQDELSDGERW